MWWHEILLDLIKRTLVYLDVSKLKTELERSQQTSLQASRASENFPLNNTSNSAPEVRMTSEAPTRRHVLFVSNEIDY